LISVQIYQQ